MLNYRYLAEEALRFGRGQLSVVAVRLPSRPQAPGELSRSDPMARLASPADVDDGLDTLIECYRLRLLHRRLRRGRTASSGCCGSKGSLPLRKHASRG